MRSGKMNTQLLLPHLPLGAPLVFTGILFNFTSNVLSLPVLQVTRLQDFDERVLIKEMNAVMEPGIRGHGENILAHHADYLILFARLRLDLW